MKIRAWFALNTGERWFLIGLCLLFLMGLTARTIHLRSQRADTAPRSGQVGEAP